MLEVRRQAVHLIFFSLFAFALLYFPYWLTSLAIGIGLGVCLIGASIVIFNLERFLPKYLHIASYLAKSAERKGERKIYEKIPFYGSIVGFLGIIISMVLLGTRAYVPILVLAWGDSASTVVGVYFGRHKVFGGRSLEGSLGFFLVALVPLFVLTPLSDVKVLILAFSATIVEIFSPIDDNLTIPIVVSVLMKFLA